MEGTTHHVRTRHTSQTRIACVRAESERAESAYNELVRCYDLVRPEESDVIVALGGDGFMLRALHAYLPLGRPMFGMNCGTVGFLMNAYRPEALLERIEAAESFKLHPLIMQAITAAGRAEEALAFNEVTVIRHTGQSANIRVVVDRVERIAKFVGDGMIVATAAGSTAYNLSAHGPIVPLGASVLALTPVSPFRPRRWRGALLPHTTEVVFENLDPQKRPLTATADFKEIVDVASVTVREDRSTTVTLLFDPDHSLEERIAAEQFAF
jgi:NAD+ kinase